MAQVTSYATLKTAVGDWMARSDISTSYIDYFIQMAEDTIYNDIFEMNEGRGVRAIETALSGTIADSVLALPDDYLALKSAYISTNNATYPLERTTSEFIRLRYPSNGDTDIPTYMAREASNFIFGPRPASGYSVGGIYWNRAAGLSSTNDTTWMTTEIPSALLAACNAAGFQFLQNSDEFARWSAIYQSLMQKFVSRNKAEEFSGSSLATAVI